MLGWMANFNGGGEALVCKYANILHRWKKDAEGEREKERERILRSLALVGEIMSDNLSQLNKIIKCQECHAV